MRPRAVIFDLWETLIDWDRDGAAEMVEELAKVIGAGFQGDWNRAPNRYIAPVRSVLRDVGVPESALDEVCELRLRYVGKALRPRPGAIDTLRRLKELGILVGLITVCTEEVQILWPESAFAGLFDAEVFSSEVALAKPDRRIYEHCCELLGIEPHEAVFVGDGANDELEGARRVGMDAILIHREGEPPLWPEVLAWDGLRVTSIPGVLTALGLD
jgi:putative hydrolase of the HAD superfamily